MPSNRKSERARFHRVATFGDLLGDLDVGAAALLGGSYLGLESSNEQRNFASRRRFGWHRLDSGSDLSDKVVRQHFSFSLCPHMCPDFMIDFPLDVVMINACGCKGRDSGVAGSGEFF
jgi:hypothetical protein